MISSLFQQSQQVIKTIDPKLYMFLHQNYHDPVKTLLLDEVYTNQNNQYEVAMSPRLWDESDPQQHISDINE